MIRGNDAPDRGIDTVSLGAEIKRLRMKRSLTQDEIAEAVGLSRASISNIEDGRQQLYLHHLYAIAEALSVTAVGLLRAARQWAEAEREAF